MIVLERGALNMSKSLTINHIYWYLTKTICQAFDKFIVFIRIIEFVFKMNISGIAAATGNIASTGRTWPILIISKVVPGQGTRIGKCRKQENSITLKEYLILVRMQLKATFNFYFIFLSWKLFSPTSWTEQSILSSSCV